MINHQLTRFFLIFLFSASPFADSLYVIAVGDIMMGSDYPKNNLPPNQGQDLFENLTPILKQADLTLGNLEGTLLTGGTCTKNVRTGKIYAFRTPPDFAQNLADAGFDFVNLANNHMNDFGTEGIASTIKTLIEASIEYGGPNGKIGKLKINGKKIAIACFAFSPGTNPVFDIKKVQQIVAEQARENGIVIVSFHGGGEGLNYLHTKDTIEYFLGSPRGNVVKFARAVIDSGADFVWGHGPHVPRAIEIYKDRLIAYSLGNFCTWGFNIAGERSYAPILKILLDSTGAFQKGEIISVQQKLGQSLEIDPQFSAARLIKQLSREDFPTSSPQINEQGIISPRKED